MHSIKVNKKSNGLTHISCSCNFRHTTDIANEVDRFVNKHSREYNSKVTYFVDDVERPPTGERVIWHSTKGAVEPIFHNNSITAAQTSSYDE